jgi:outer membrane protein assembly factor BamB
VPDHPDGFEWCVNQPAIDAAGIVYANSEDGYLYAIGADGRVIQRIFLRLAIGAAYTPLSIGGDGILYTQNDGHLFAVGNPPRATPVGSPRRPHPRPVERPAAKQ